MALSYFKISQKGRILRLHPDELPEWDSSSIVLFPLHYVWDIELQSDIRMQAWGLFSFEDTESAWQPEIARILTSAKESGNDEDQTKAATIFDCNASNSGGYLQVSLPPEIFGLEWMIYDDEIICFYTPDGVTIWTKEAIKYHLAHRVL